MKKNTVSKAAVGTGGTLVTVGVPMLTNPVTFAPGLGLVIGGVVVGFLGALFHDPPKKKKKGTDDDG
jgi:hypothetical protein